MKRAISALVILSSLACALVAGAREVEKRPLIQLAILLDTSSSMSGLIGQAKSELWNIVNQFATATHDGVRPDLQVALYEYGKSSLDGREGFIRRIVSLTHDLDRISEELFALETHGGDEYCGWVIQRAVEELSWSEGNDDLRTIYIAGNEPFSQGNVNYRSSCKAAAAKGITVNTIFCGPYDAGVLTQWQKGALLADGAYMNIDQNRRVVAIAAPQDVEIAALGERLNSTYIAFGQSGAQYQQRQRRQDAASKSLSLANMAQRSVTKSSSFYQNTAWDLVDATDRGGVRIEDVKAADLPGEMRGMSVDERRAHVEQKAKERTEIQARIKELNAARQEYIAGEMKKRTESQGEQTLDQAVIRSLREQAEAKGSRF
jgi:hypothetical protein